jgi:hypothetical protein
MARHHTLQASNRYPPFTSGARAGRRSDAAYTPETAREVAWAPAAADEPATG